MGPSAFCRQLKQNPQSNGNHLPAAYPCLTRTEPLALARLGGEAGVVADAGCFLAAGDA